MFPIAAITMRRERSNGTLDRLFTTPMSKLDLLAGYGTAFSLGAAGAGRDRHARRLPCDGSAHRRAAHCSWR